MSAQNQNDILDRNNGRREYFRQWARERPRFTVRDVLAEIKRIGYSKGNVRGSSFAGVNDVRVRVDADRFVPDEEVRFDVDKIDSALDRIVGKYAMPYGAIRGSDLQLLPTVPSYSWNPYLLTSFAWRFSRKFEFLHFHNRPHTTLGGAIARKECGYHKMYKAKAYERLLGDVVRDAGIAIDGDVIDRWLMENNWICRLSGVGNRIAARLRSTAADC